MRNLFFYFLSGIILISCEAGKSENEKKTELNIKTAKDTAKIKSNSDSSQLTAVAFKLEIFTNMEQIPFCIALPLNKYTPDTEQSEEKAKFIFTKRGKKENYIEVRGLIRADESISLEKYFENSTSAEETEAQGKIITDKQIRADNGCFIVRGYWSNFPEQEFVEIIFLRKEDVVTFYWSYDMETERNLNYKIVEAIISYGTECEE